jgi:chromosome segregation ATPase
MDHESLRTASTYLNNLLLARGLLRNSEPIDFVKPSKESRAQIINLVHDLILREDRDREQREHVASTMRTMRAEENRKNHDIERLTTQREESKRSLVQAQAAERTAQTEVKKVEKAMKSLQDQAAKLKTTLAQVKTQCTNDLRKRDLEISRLKTHLQGQQRCTISKTQSTVSNRKRPNS